MGLWFGIVLCVLSCFLTEISGVSLTSTSPAPVDPSAVIARNIVRQSNWATLAHISNQDTSRGYPQARVFSVVDGPVFNSTGVPYIYAPLVDEGVQDLINDGRCSMTMSLAEGDYCHTKSYDPEDPRCAQVILTGKCTAVPNNTLEWVFARDALFSQHPIMAKWPLAHNWLVIRLNIINIILVDNFGGNKYPSVSDYFHATPDNYDNVRESRPTDNHYEPQTNEDGLDDQIEVVEVLNYI